MISELQFIMGLGILSYMDHEIDCYDDRTGRRPGACRDAYGSNVSYTWRNVAATVGFLMALTAPLTWILSE